MWKTCPNCGKAANLTEGPCERCHVAGRLNEVLAGADGKVRAGLIGLRDALLAERPETAVGWLRNPAASRLLDDLASGAVELSHEGLDAAGPIKVVRHLRSVLVSIGTLPARDEQMVRLEQWVAETVAARADPDEARLLRRYAGWHLIRRLRRRQGSTETTYSQAVTIKRHVQAAVLLTDWLTDRGLSLASAGQGDLDAWVGEVSRARVSDAGNFVRWAKAQRLTGLDLAASRWRGPTAAIDTDLRWSQARCLLGDETLDPADRVAGLLVLLYAQRIAAVSRLSVDKVDPHSQGVRLWVGDRPIEVPEPLGRLLCELVARRRGHAAVGELCQGPWLFPGGQPGQPISASRLNERLAGLGVRTGSARTAALMQLAGELPAAVIARMLGLHIKVAVEWQHLASGDWAGYAAHYSRRSQPELSVNRG